MIIDARFGRLLAGSGGADDDSDAAAADDDDGDNFDVLPVSVIAGLSGMGGGG